MGKQILTFGNTEIERINSINIKVPYSQKL